MCSCHVCRTDIRVNDMLQSAHLDPTMSVTLIDETSNTAMGEVFSEGPLSSNPLFESYSQLRGVSRPLAIRCIPEQQLVQDLTSAMASFAHTRALTLCSSRSLWQWRRSVTFSRSYFVLSRLWQVRLQGLLPGDFFANGKPCQVGTTSSVPRLIRRALQIEHERELSETLEEAKKGDFVADEDVIFCMQLRKRSGKRYNSAGNLPRSSATSFGLLCRR